MKNKSKKKMSLLNYILPKAEDFNCCCIPKNPRGCISCCLFTLLGTSLLVSSIKESKASDASAKSPAAYSLQLIDYYQKEISPELHQKLGTNRICRYTPSCSEYAKQAIQKKGAFLGTVDGTVRLLRCNPFSQGGYNPVKSNKTQEHFRTLGRIVCEESWRTAIEYDWETTKEDFKKLIGG